MKKLLIIFFCLISIAGYPQLPYIVEGQTYTNSASFWIGVDMRPGSPRLLTFRNNSITSQNTSYAQFIAGDDSYLSSHNYLDNAVISGNKTAWNGIASPDYCHTMMTGYNINDKIKYNYSDKGQYGVIFKSGGTGYANMSYTSGGLYYNILKNKGSFVHIKGMNGVNVYNNTLFEDTKSGAIMIKIIANEAGFSPQNITIKNNIIYTSHKNTASIAIDDSSLTTLVCDYNVYYNTATSGNTPVFKIVTYSPYAETIVTWTQWRTKFGKDAHSVVVDPDFNNTTDLVPSTRLDYGTDLGSGYNYGLSTKAKWVAGYYPDTTRQNGTWQVGARIFEAEKKRP